MKIKNKKQNGIMCFNCKDRKFNSKPNINNVGQATIERDSAELNSLEYFVLLDTGSSHNLIHKNLLYNFKSKKVIKLKTPLKLELLNGNNLIIKNEIELEIKYKGKTIKDIFKIYDHGREDIIFGYNLVKKLKEKKCEKQIIPIECNIKPASNEIISWSRPIKSRQDFIEFQKLAKELEERGIIEPSQSLWLNPVVLVRKKTGALRFCVDFRKLNDIVPSDGFPLPKIQNLLSSLRNKRYFSSIDLMDGFFHINVKKEDREKTTFKVRNRLMQFVKMPQGYKNSPSIFQRAMTLILEGLVEKSCLIYIDNILIFGKDSDEHDLYFKLVSDRIKQYGLKENLEKE